MQDIGGCRAILQTTDDVYELLGVYQDADIKNPTGRPKLHRTTDYIEEPSAL